MALLAGLIVLWSFSPNRCQSAASSTEIFRGVTYGCATLRATEEGNGLIHWVQIDLTVPGIELFVTPLEHSAVAQGWQYRLRGTEDVVKSEHLAVAINAALFTSDSAMATYAGRSCERRGNRRV